MQASGQSGRTRAVVFDLFGTLVTYPPGAPHVRAMAEELGTDFEPLHAAWRKLRARRDAGEVDTAGALRLCCGELGLAARADRIEAACTAVATFFRGLLAPRDGALSTIGLLRERGLRIGLVSDANIEVSRAWPESALAPLVDAAVFSCDAHVRKPDPRLYRAVREGLAVPASECLYAGNGDGDELAGAMRAGMRAVLFAAPGELPGREAASWRGPRITDLGEIVALL
jgi:putative hydrolase of the HAD superfamily